MAEMAALMLLSVVLFSLAGKSLQEVVYAEDMIRARGFIAETYHVQTPAGIPLTLHRIVNPLADPNTLNKYPVLYGHGVLYDSQSMISRSEHSKPRKPVLGQPTILFGTESADKTDDFSLPFMFSNNNFDVWLFDARGVNAQGRNLSVQIDPVQANKFWDFSLDDESLIDLPRLMDFVLTHTASTKLVYVGYSESTFFMFALMSAKPEFAEKVAAFIAMAPVAYVSNIRGMTLPVLSSIGIITPEFLHYSILPQPAIETIDTTLRTLCATGLAKGLCKSFVDSVGGQGSGEMGASFFLQFYKATSIKALKQFTQLYKSKRFAMYDYGKAANVRLYGTPYSPEYNLARIVSDRIILVRGLADFLADPQDQIRLIKELGRKPYLDIVLPSYNHFDFIDGKDLIKLVNAPVMKAVYELIYKDGPNILKSPDQAQKSANNRQLYLNQQPTTRAVAVASASGSSASAVAGASINKPQSIFDIQTNLMKNLLGGINRGKRSVRSIGDD